MRRDPYIHASIAFAAGNLSTGSAIGMVASDLDFIAEAELQGRNRFEAAREVVLTVWLPALVRSRKGRA